MRCGQVQHLNGFQLLGLHCYIVRQEYRVLYMAKSIIMRSNLFIICVCYVLLYSYLFCRGENRLTWLVHLFYDFQKICPWPQHVLMPYKMATSKAVQVFALDHTSGHNSSVDVLPFKNRCWVNTVHI